MSNIITVIARIEVEGGTADKGLLDIHDAAHMTLGLARAVNIVAHGFANNDESRTRAKTATGSQTFIRAAQKGCFEEQIEVHFFPQTIAKIGASVIVKNFWDYLEFCWSHAVGREYKAATPFVTNRSDQETGEIFELGDALETPMQELHAPITRDENMKISLIRQRIGNVLTLNRETHDYVFVREIESNKLNVSANVTKFNMLSGFGRFYSDVDQRVMSFGLVDPNDQEMQSLMINSMKERIDGKSDGKLTMVVTRTVSAQGVPKKYTVHSARKP